jgi:hypothetical protein
MDQDKRAIIIREIQYWKRNRLLPEHYCDFLLNLYGSGQAESGAARERSAVAAMRDGGGLLWIAATGILVTIAIFALNFNVFPLPLQMMASLLFVISLFIFGVKVASRSLPIAYLSLGAGCLLMLIVGEWLLIDHVSGQPGWAIGYLAFCCLIWTIFGAWLRLAFLSFSGLTGMLFVYAWLLNLWLDPLYGAWLQLAWIVASALFLWIARTAGRNLRSLGRSCFIVGGIAWLAPEIMVAIFGGELTALLQLALVGKIVAAGILLMIFRKKWIEWVV